ncbi:MAG: UDP-N-acetylmuramoyl-L-alanyl-D-glutamate--2,6-diaminopimelate ligase [Actinomycetota bacterium]
MTVALTSLARMLETVSTVGALESVALRRAVADSRLVQEGDLFCCIVGDHSDGHDFAEVAVAQGAVALLVDHALALPVPQLVLEPSSMRHQVALAAQFLAGRPSEALAICGVTGTNGKTTVTQMLGSIARTAGRPTTVIGTLSGSRTTPEAPELAEFLADARDEAKAEGVVGVVALEVSSHALALSRVDGIRFSVACFTNLSHDHLDFHGTMEAYFAAKAELFTKERCEKAVIFVDDQAGARLAEMVDVPVIPVSMSDATSIDLGLNGSWFTWRDLRVHVPLPGMVNIANALVALAAGIALGLKPDACVVGLSAMALVPGRLQRIASQRNDAPTVFIDYAHTPAGLATVLIDLRRLMAKESSLTVVFGCGGDRDQMKRAPMGEAAVRLADSVFVTNDNPRSEDPRAIADQILSGMSSDLRGQVQVVLDRRLAIEQAISNARVGDVVLVAGKGHEGFQVAGDTTLPFNDAQIAQAALASANEEATCSPS